MMNDEWSLVCMCMGSLLVTVQRLLFACYSGDEFGPHTVIVNCQLALSFIPAG